MKRKRIETVETDGLDGDGGRKEGENGWRRREEGRKT